MIRVTVWNEFRHEKASKEVAAIIRTACMQQLPSFLAKTTTSNAVWHVWMIPSTV